MPRPDMSKTQTGVMLYCVGCGRPIRIAVIRGWYVFHCPCCERMYEQADCKHVPTKLIVKPPKKGDSINGNQKGFYDNG